MGDEPAAEGAGRSGGRDAASGGEPGDAGAAAAAAPAPQCEPQAGEYTVLEDHKLTVTQRCGIAGVTASTWELESLPAGADFDPATGVLSWQPALDQAASYKLTARTMPWAEVAKFRGAPSMSYPKRSLTLSCG
jgi:hypothetical protein